jgi:hypothetical protein
VAVVSAAGERRRGHCKNHPRWGDESRAGRGDWRRSGRVRLR